MLFPNSLSLCAFLLLSAKTGTAQEENEMDGRMDAVRSQTEENNVQTDNSENRQATTLEDIEKRLSAWFYDEDLIAIRGRYLNSIINTLNNMSATLNELKQCMTCRKPTPPITCPTGYKKYVNDTCGNSCYRYESSQCKSWNDARQTCQKEGGDLMIPTECSYQFFREQAKQNEGTCSQFWIGGYTNTPGKKYVTVKGDPIPTSFSYWTGSQPDGLGGESCLEMRSYFTNYLMNDYHCRVGEGFICQIFP
ncbi:hypothetical protein CHS0354_039060 [Potamilus streckersoni]|uniref:C-type lectin domain-containing protein n=1 Tax=Potamilus streckersoni TaxID=2493646 RepID=A0AAE0RRI7_9BIVA|nr:hypothetical protein CHS0354_039060 [Potamilus streckersoni]